LPADRAPRHQLHAISLAKTDLSQLFLKVRRAIDRDDTCMLSSEEIGDCHSQALSALRFGAFD